MIEWTREEVERHSVDMRQFIDFRQSTLLNGMRIVEAYNSSGLTFSLLPDRGLDIWTATYNGLPLTWISQGAPHLPDFGQTWLQQFNGGLLTTCGLMHVGPPETDDASGEIRDVHGRYSRLRAVNLWSGGFWDENGHYVAEFGGLISQTSLFGEQLRLERTYRLRLGAPIIWISDTITNLGDTPSPLMILYHFNLGYPLVAEGTRLFAPSEAVYPRDEAAAAGFDLWRLYQAATPGYAEQVFFHHLKCHPLEGLTKVLLYRDNTLGLSLGWDPNELPYFTQWKNARQGIYVSGIEPGNCIPEGQNAARANGRLQTLGPGEQRQFSCYVWVTDDIALHKDQVDELIQTGNLIDGCHLDDYAGQEF